MKKKLAIFALLFALMVSMVGAVPVKAEENNLFNYDSEYYTITNVDTGAKVSLPSNIIERVKNGDEMYIMVYYSAGDNQYYFKVLVTEANCTFGVGRWGTWYFYVFDAEGKQTYDKNVTVQGLRYDANSSVFVVDGDSECNAQNIADYNGGYYYYCSGSFSLYSTSDVAWAVVGDDGNGSKVRMSSNAFYQSKKYDLEEWCGDAGLNCDVSSREDTSAVVPFWYDSAYAYLITKNDKAEYRMFMIQMKAPTNRILVGNKSLNHFGMGCYYEDESQTLVVREFKYDVDGWLFVQKRDIEYKDYIMDIGVSWGENERLVYTSHNICSDYDGWEILQESTKTYIEHGYGVTPTPTPTPTQAPSGGSGSATYSWYYVKYTVGSNEYTGYVLGDYLDFEDSVNAVVNKDRTAVYEEMYVTTQIQHYLDEGDEVRIVEEYEIGLESGSFMAKVNELIGMIRGIPELISAVYSFMPPWCLAVVGLVFSIALVVFGIKVIF